MNANICPTGYSAPSITDFGTLIQAYGGTVKGSGYHLDTNAIYSALGLSTTRYYWSSTENKSGYAYYAL